MAKAWGNFFPLRKQLIYSELCVRLAADVLFGRGISGEIFGSYLTSSGLLEKALMSPKGQQLICPK